MIFEFLYQNEHLIDESTQNKTCVMHALYMQSILLPPDARIEI